MIVCVVLIGWRSDMVVMARGLECWRLAWFLVARLLMSVCVVLVDWRSD